MLQSAQAALNAVQWKSQIDDYSLPPLEGGAQNGVDLLKAESKSILLEGVVKSIEAREKFLDYLANVHSNETKKADGINKETVTMEALLGTEGLALYHAAIREEVASQAFREAVFNISTQKHEGAKWNKRLILWVGGPSASGKTAASERAVKIMGDQVMTKSASNEGNYVVSVDGGIEREMSQMRQMVLQIALSKGYKGIENLHSHTKLGIKRKIKKAALADGKMSLVIPETFASSLPKSASKGLQIRKKEMKNYENMDNTVQVFTEVMASKSASRFQRTIALMGESRAWYEHSEKFPDSKIAMNNRNIGCESKKYEPHNFKYGKFASRRARKTFLRISKEERYYKISHDLMYVTEGANNEWRECKDADKNVAKVLISEKNFEIWKLMVKGKLTERDLNELKQYAGFKEDMTLNQWASFCYKHSINPPLITREKTLIQMLGTRQDIEIKRTDTPSRRPSPLISTYRSAPESMSFHSQTSEVSLKQTHSNIKTLSDYLNSNKAQHYIVNCVEKSSSQGIPTSLEITFKNEANNSEPKVVAQNVETQNAVNFLTKSNMPDEDFVFVAQQTAKMAVAMAEPGTVFDLSSTPKAKLDTFEKALLEAIEEAMNAEPPRLSERPSVQGGTRSSPATHRPA